MQNVKICAVGDGSVGKTCLLISYTTNCFPQEYVPTVFDNYSIDVMRGDAPVHVTVSDTAGQDEYKDLRTLSYPDSNAFLVCFAVNSTTSFANIETKWIPEIQLSCPNVPIILVGTKSDLRTSGSVTAAQAKSLCDKIKAVCYMECSALTRDGLSAVFDKAVDVSIGKNDNTKPMKTKKKTICMIL